MKKRMIALLLAAALSASVCAASALADEQAQSPAVESAEPAEGGARPAGEKPPREALSPAGPDLADNVTLQPDLLGEISFANLESRIRENNLQVLALQENIAGLEQFDYDALYEDLRTSLNLMARGKRLLTMVGEGSSYSHAQMEQAYSSVRAQFDAIKEGDMQKDNAGLIRQLKNLQDQIVMAGESLYVALSAMETQEAGLQRQLTALNRTAEEMELRYQMGQISAMQLSQVKSGRTSLESGLSTLQMNIRNYKLQLEMLIGAELTGEITLRGVPEAGIRQLEAMNPEADLASAKEKSYELYDAEQTLEDAREDYINAGAPTGYKMDQQLWQAAQYTYNNAVQSYELKFRTLYAQVGDYRQIWEAAKTALACEQESHAAAELRYQQGTISKNAFLDAEDSLQAAEEKVRSAAGDLFSAYNTYCWAVQHGILN